MRSAKRTSSASCSDCLPNPDSRLNGLYWPGSPPSRTSQRNLAELFDVPVGVHDLPEIPPTSRLSVGPRRFWPSNDSIHLRSRSLKIAAGQFHLQTVNVA